MVERKLKKIIQAWLDSPEGKANSGALILKNAPLLLNILQDSPYASRLLELAVDGCQKSLRKASGMFFTPGKAAAFMVRNALELWRKDHPSLSELKAVKILDPACGGGEFLIAALEELLKLRKKLEPDMPEKVLINSIIKNNLFGIDCDKNVLDLLLKRLELRSDSAIDRQNFVHANALEYPDASQFFNGRKFNIVIGNPPYVSYGLRNVDKLSKSEAECLKKRFPDSAEYKITLYALFMEFAINSVNCNDVHSFIVPDSFLCGQYFSKLRNFMLKKLTFEHILLLKKNIFKAVPGNLVIYLASVKNSPREHLLKTCCFEDDLADLLTGSYNMLQRSFAENHRQRFRLFFDDHTQQTVENMENSAVCKLSDLLELASGVIAKHGKNSIIADHQSSSGFWRKGVTCGSAVKSDQPVVWQGEFINLDPKQIKSGLKKIDYDADKILIRQTGDRIIAAVDRNKLAVLNNLHVGTAKDPSLDLDRLTRYLNSDELNFYYQAVTMESARPLAQIDLETLRELPMPEDFKK